MPDVSLGLSCHSQDNIPCSRQAYTVCNMPSLITLKFLQGFSKHNEITISKKSKRNSLVLVREVANAPRRHTSFMAHLLKHGYDTMFPVVVHSFNNGPMISSHKVGRFTGHVMTMIPHLHPARTTMLRNVADVMCLYTLLKLFTKLVNCFRVGNRC